MEGRLDRSLWHKHGHTVIIYVFLVTLMVFVSIFNKDFFTLGNFKNPLRFSFPLFMAALGQTLIILIGRIDSSLGETVALCNVVCITSMNPDSAWEFIPALGAAVTMGLACGAINGVLITKGRLASIIVTIATTTILDKMALLLMPNPGGNVRKAFTKFLVRGYSGTVSFLLFIPILCLMRSLADSTPYGKASRAIGGSESAAYSTDIRVGEIKFCAYCLIGLLCVVAGIFLSVQMNSADAIIGKNYAMNAITVTVVGGTAMTGVVGGPLGIITDVFTVSIINNMLNLLGISSFYQFICQGLILIAALSLNVLRKRHQGLWGPVTKDKKAR